VALLSKIESEEPFEDELGKFNKLFVCDNELIGLVKDLISDMKIATTENSDGIVNVCKNVVKKIMKCKRNNGKNLERISGYVLSSRDCDGE
jgi:predicted HicB family RNase H-like nuclease